MMIIFVVFIVLIGLYILSTMCRKAHKDLPQLRRWAYAHRGLHGNGIPENSMRAFRKAKDAGYGVELDVHLMADGNLAVIHDSSLMRTAGADVLIEDLNTEQLDEYYLEGTLESVPKFSQVLDLFNGEMPLIVELKVYRNNYAELCEAVCDVLDQYNGAFCLESFDPRCIRWLRKNRPEYIRGQLSENYFKSKNSTLPWILKLLLSWQMLNFASLPDFVAYRYSDCKHLSNFVCRKVWGVQGVTWTIKNQDDFDNAVSGGWIPIFEGFMP